jgi:hypothetical protein
VAAPLDDLRRSVEAHSWERAAVHTFELLYGLPAERARSVAHDAVARGGPFFRHLRPEIAWPFEILGDPVAWARDHGRRTGEAVVDAGVGYGSWVQCFDALLLGIVEASDPVVRTAAFATAVHRAASSRALAIWEVDDFEAVDLWRSGSLGPDRTYDRNAAARAVLEREWWRTVERVAAEAALGPPAAAGDEVREAVARWRAHECGLIVPRRSS